MQGSIDTQSRVYNISWDVLRAAKNLYNATLFLGGTAVTAPPFYDVAGRLNVLFWHSITTRSTLDLEDNPLVMSLADFTRMISWKKIRAPPSALPKLGYPHTSPLQGNKKEVLLRPLQE